MIVNLYKVTVSLTGKRGWKTDIVKHRAEELHKVYRYHPDPPSRATHRVNKEQLGRPHTMMNQTNTFMTYSAYCLEERLAETEKELTELITSQALKVIKEIDDLRRFIKDA